MVRVEQLCLEGAADALSAVISSLSSTVALPDINITSTEDSVVHTTNVTNSIQIALRGRACPRLDRQ